jgi:hypothetical protein
MSLSSSTTEMHDRTIILYIGKYLQENEFVSPLDIQKEILQDEGGAGGYMIDMGRLKLNLTILSLAGFIEEIGDKGIYTLKNKTIVHETVIKNIVPFAELRTSVEE